jgi:hypothetical protein
MHTSKDQFPSCYQLMKIYSETNPIRHCGVLKEEAPVQIIEQALQIYWFLQTGKELFTF